LTQRDYAKAAPYPRLRWRPDDIAEEVCCFAAGIQKNYLMYGLLGTLFSITFRLLLITDLHRRMEGLSDIPVSFET
jgi:hypothetical protein